jgi:predicted aspartyl protease
MHVRSFPSLLLSLFALSCGGAADKTPARAATKPPAPEAAWATPQSPRPSRSTKLRFELAGHEFPLPVVHGTVAGEPTWLLIDTGANSLVLASWVAKKAGLKLHPLGDVGSDHTGRTVMTYAVDHPDVAIDGWGDLDDGPMLVTNIPVAVERLGIGGFISPQWLAGRGDAIVLDLANERMSRAPFASAVRSVQDRGRELPTHPRVCDDSESTIKGLAFVVPATIAGQSVNLLVDTGAHKTDLLTSSRAGQALGSRSVQSDEELYAASGLVRTRTVKGADVRVGGVSLTTDVDLVPGGADSVCPRDGVVSMDILKTCVLVMGHKQLIGRCGD